MFRINYSKLLVLFKTISKSFLLALIYYEGEFRRIMVNFANLCDLEIFEKKMNALTFTIANPDRAKKILIESDMILINRCYNELVDFVRDQYSRYAYQALAIFLMEHGAMMIEYPKKLVLENSLWKDERHKLEERRERFQRKKFLFDFRAKVLDYKVVLSVREQGVQEN